MRCISCREEYLRRDAGTCKECYVEAGETEEELKREIEDLKAKVNFLRFPSSIDHGSSRSFTDVVLIASQDAAGAPPIPAHKAILADLWSAGAICLWSPNGKRLACGLMDGTICVFDGVEKYSPRYLHCIGC